MVRRLSPARAIAAALVLVVAFPVASFAVRPVYTPVVPPPGEIGDDDQPGKQGDQPQPTAAIREPASAPPSQFDSRERDSARGRYIAVLRQRVVAFGSALRFDQRH